MNVEFERLGSYFCSLNGDAEVQLIFLRSSDEKGPVEDRLKGVGMKVFLRYLVCRLHVRDMRGVRIGMHTDFKLDLKFEFDTIVKHVVELGHLAWVRGVVAFSNGEEICPRRGRKVSQVDSKGER